MANGGAIFQIPSAQADQSGANVPTKSTTGLDTAEKIRKVEAILAPILKQFQAVGGGGAPTPGLPGRVGGAPPGMVAPPPQAGQMPGSAGGGGGAGIQPQQTIPQMGQVTPALAPAPQSGLFQTGFEFRTKAGARGATTASAIQGVSQFINDQRKRREEQQAKEAQNLMTLLMEAQKNPQDPKNKAIIEAITGDPKKMKILEKAYGEVMKLGEQPELSPAARGVTKAVEEAKKAEQAQGGGGGGQGRMLPTLGPTPEAKVQAAGQNTAMMQQAAAQKGLSFGPQQIQQLRDTVVAKADTAMQPILSGMLQASEMFPAQAPEMVKGVLQANADYAIQKEAYGQQIALLNQKEVFQQNLEMLKENFRTQLQSQMDNARDDRTRMIMQGQMDRTLATIDGMMARAELAADARNRPKPLTAKQTLDVSQKRDMADSFVKSLDDALSPSSMKVIGSTLSSIKARMAGTPLARFTPASTDETKVSGTFTRLKEQTNQLREAYGATGFRSFQALEALWNVTASDNWWYANPEVTTKLLTDAKADAKRLINNHNEALAIGHEAESGEPVRTGADNPLGLDLPK